jgi:hypothetical protein
MVSGAAAGPGGDSARATGPTGSESATKAPRVVRATSRSRIRVPASRVIRGAKVECVQGDCRIRKVSVRYKIGNRVFDGGARFQNQLTEGQSRVIQTTMASRLFRKLAANRAFSNNVTFVVTVTSSNGTRTLDYVRTRLLR